jgi:hypothetical protein
MHQNMWPQNMHLTSCGREKLLVNRCSSLLQKIELSLIELNKLDVNYTSVTIAWHIKWEISNAYSIF